MKVFQAIVASSAFAAATIGAHAASFIGQTIDGALLGQPPGFTVTTPFTSPIIGPGTFDGVVDAGDGNTFDVTVQVLSTEVIVGWIGTGFGNTFGKVLLTIDLSGFTNGPLLGLDSYSCMPPGNPVCGVAGGRRPRSAA